MGNIKKTFLHKTLRIAALFIGGIAIGFGVGFVIGKIIKPALHADISAADVFLTILLAAIFFILSFIIHIVIHEAGHMLAAMARGWKFLSFMIMGVVLSRRDGRFRLIVVSNLRHSAMFRPRSVSNQIRGRVVS